MKVLVARDQLQRRTVPLPAMRVAKKATLDLTVHIGIKLVEQMHHDNSRWETTPETRLLDLLNKHHQEETRQDQVGDLKIHNQEGRDKEEGIALDSLSNTQVKLLVDTGASYSFISVWSAKILGLTSKMLDRILVLTVPLGGNANVDSI